MAAEEKWYFSKEQLENSPSRKCNIDSDKELSYRQQAANFIQDVGQRLHVTQLCINTAIVYMHRFYVFHSFTQFHRYSMASAALFLAAKVEELPRKLEHVVKVAQICLHKEEPGASGTAPDIKSEQYVQAAHDLVFNENVLLQTLGFDVAIDHPHTHVVRCCQLVKASKDLAQTSYFLASNSLHLTTMCLQYKPAVVACFCIYLACKWSNWKIPPSSEGKQWFMYVDESVTDELLDELTAEFMVIYNKCPSRLKKKIESMSASLGQSSGNHSGSSSGSNYNSPMAPDAKKLQGGPHKEGDPYHSKSHPSKSGVPHPHRPHPDPNKERERQMSGSSSMPHHPKPTDPTKHPPQNHRPPHSTVPPQHRSQHHRPTDPKLKPPPGHPHSNRPPGQPYPHPRPEQRPDQRPEQRPEQRPDQRPEQRPEARQDQRPDPYRDPYRRDITAPRDPTFPGKEPPKDLFAPSNITTEREILKEQQMRERHNAAAGVDSQSKDLFRERPPDPHKQHLFSNNSELKKIDPNKLQRPPDPNRHKGDKMPRIDPTKKTVSSVKVNSHPQSQQLPVVRKVETPSPTLSRNGNHVSESEKVIEQPIIPPVKVKSIFSPEKEVPKDIPSPSKKLKTTGKSPSSKKDLTAEFNMVPPALSPFGSPPPSTVVTTPNSKNRNRTSSSSSEAELMVVINKLENIKGYEHMIKDQKGFKIPKPENEIPRDKSPVREIKEEKVEPLREEVAPVNGIETDPMVISNLLKELPPVNHLTEIKKEDETVSSQEGHHRSEKKKKKDKHKHKDKDRSRDEKKKKHKDKDKDRSKTEMAPLKITIAKDKITPPPSIQTTPTISTETTSLPTSLKIKIPKDRIKTDTLPMLNNSNRSSLKIKISKDKIVEDSGSRKRERDSSESQGPSKIAKTTYKSSSSSSSQNGRNYNTKVSLGEGGQVGGSGSLQQQPPQWSTTQMKLAESKYHSKVSGSNKQPPPT